VADADEWWRPRFRGPVEGADDGRLDDGEIDRITLIVGAGRRRGDCGDGCRRSGGCRWRGRCRGWRKRRIDHFVAGLAYTHLESVALEFELLEVVLADEVENLFDVVEIHKVRQRRAPERRWSTTPRPSG